MLSIVLFALIGAAIDANVAYWICFGVYSVCNATMSIAKFINAVSDQGG